MKILKRILSLLFILLFLFIISNTALFLYAKITPKLEVKAVNSLNLYAGDDTLFFQGNGSSKWVALNDVSQNVIDATVSIEDKNFWKHNGFDYPRIMKAAWTNLKARSIEEGASTITQQYAKNMFLTFDKKWERKLEEMMLSFELEAHYSKEEILEGYINMINYGHGVYGIENAANFYFNKSAKDLDLAEASMLAGIPNAPSYYSPLIDELSAKDRQNTTLNSMVANGYISENEKKSAFSEQLVYVGKKNNLNLATIMYFQDAVIKELHSIDTVPDSFLETGGLNVYTTLDINAQSYLDEAVEANMKDDIALQVASVVMNPETGGILALVGGRDYAVSQYNRATESKRPVGSTIKPFLYYGALENGFTSATTFISEPTTFTFGEGKTYSPHNYSDTYGNKPITMALALAYSDNIYAVKTNLFLGEDVLVENASLIGISDTLDPVPSIALGSKEINITDMVKGFSTLSNSGYKVESHLINKITDKDGNILYEFDDVREKILDSNYTFILSEMLAGCDDYDLIDYLYPTCSVISPKLSGKYAMKTGSTGKDSWIFGYNPDVAIGVWVGYDENADLPGGTGRIPKNIFADTIEDYFRDEEKNWYEIPENVVGVLVNPVTGEMANTDSKMKKILYFVKGTEPYYEGKVLDNIINAN